MPALSEYDVLKTVTLTSSRQVHLIRDSASGSRRILKRVSLSDIQAVEAERRGAELQRALYVKGGAIPQIFRIDEEDGYLVIEMDYLDGASLQSRIGRATPIEATRIIIALLIEVERWRNVRCQGRTLETVVHGDLKPPHVLWTTAGRLGVLDFGIAKGLADSGADTRNPFRSLVYVPPERLRNIRVDEGSDLWASGITLYESVTGYVPFKAIDKKVNFTSTLPRSPRLPEGLYRVLSKALHLDPSQRYQSPREFRYALESWLAAAEPSRADQPATELDNNESDKATQLDPETVPPQVARRGLLDWLPVVQIRFDPRSVRRIALMLLTLAVAALSANQALVWRSAERVRADLRERHITSIQAGKECLRLKQRNLIPPMLTPLLAAAQHALSETAMAPILQFRQDTPQIDRGDWTLALNAMNALSDLNPSNPAWHGKELLVQGHLARLRRNWNEAIRDLQGAAQADSSSPDPYIALAVIYAYGRMNRALLDDAIAAASTRGHTAGRRESAQLADAYAIEASHVRVPARTGRRAALLRKRDLTEKAANLYQRIPGFAKADHELERCVQNLKDIDSQLQGAIQ